MTFEKKKVGECPECGKPVYESKFGWGCSGYKEGCKFMLWRDDKFLKKFGRKMTASLAKKFLSFEPFEISLKKGEKHFTCMISLEKKDNGFWGYHLDFTK